MSPSHCTVIPLRQPLMSCHGARLRHTLQHWTPATTPLPLPLLAHTSRPLTSTFTPVGIPFGRAWTAFEFWSCTGHQINRFHCAVAMAPPTITQRLLKPAQRRGLAWGGGEWASSVCASFVMAICINKSLALPVGASVAGGGGGSFGGAGWCYNGFVALRGGKGQWVTPVRHLTEIVWITWWTFHWSGWGGL